VSDLPQAVTFDFHNTIARCDHWFDLEVRDLLPAFLTWLNNESGVEPVLIDFVEAKTRYRKLRREIMETGYERDAETCVDLVTREFGVVLPDEVIHAGVQAIMLETLPGSKPLDGVVDAVIALHEQGVRLGVVSSAAYHPFLEWSLQKFGILDRFTTVVTSASCGYYKSRTEIYEITLNRLKADPGRSVHIGDSEKWDVGTSAKLGMRTVLLDEHGKQKEESKANAIVSSLRGVEQIAIRLGQESRA
jgi:FMN phosphatase YigB (HAD superfamily)